MSLLLPLDDNGHPIAVLGFHYRGTVKLSVTRTSARNPAAVPADIDLVTLIATGPCRFEVGDAAVIADAATSPFLFPGQYVDVPLRSGSRFVAFVAEDQACAAYIIART